MRSTRWLVVAVASVLGFLGLLAGAPQGAEAQSYTASETELVELINAYRQENGLAPLSTSTPLTVAAERHSEDMGTYGFFSHTTQQSSYYPAGSGHSERIAQEGYTANAFTAENLAYGQATAQEAFTAWQNSPGHNAAMLGDYSVVGVGQVTVGGVPYWTAVFGSEAGSSAQNTAPTEPEPSANVPNTPPDGASDEPIAQDAEPDTRTVPQTAPQAAQYDAGNETAETAETSFAPTVEQYEARDAAEESNVDRTVRDRYEASETGSEVSNVGEQYGSEADEYRTNAERFRAAADQYGAEAEQARREAVALLNEQAEASSETSSGAAMETPARDVATPVRQTEDPADAEVASDTEESGQNSEPSEKMASTGMTVLPDTGGLAGGKLVGGILGAALVVCVLVPARRLLG